MDSEFIIPISKDDLMSGEAGTYIVEEIFTVRSLTTRIQDAVSEIENQGPSAILRKFDVFFSVMKNFPDVSNTVKFNCWQTLYQALTDEISNIISLLEDDCDRETKKVHRNILKMLAYLLTQFTEEFEAEDSKPSTVTSAAKARGKNAKAKKQSPLPFDWSATKEDFLRMVSHLLQVNIVSLWEPPVIEEEFVNCFANCFYKLLENPCLTRDKVLRDLIVEVLCVLVKKYNHALSLCVKIIQLLQHFEHLVSPLVQLVQVCAVEKGMKSIVVEIMRELGQIDPKDLARDTSGTKCYSDFLVELTSKISELILPNISLLLCHLDGESYSMRNGVLGVMGEIVILQLSCDELDDNVKKTRDQILDRLEEHIHDVHAFVRSKILQIWQNICRAKAIPLSRQQNLLGLVISRLKDKSSMVRKNAVALLKEFLMFNPFGAQLPLEQVQKQLNEEIAKLKEMAPELFENCDEAPPQVDEKLLDYWSSLEQDVKMVVEKYWDVDDIVDEDGEHVEFQGDIHDALEFALINIKGKLVKKENEKALAVLKAALVTWPDAEIFQNEKRTDNEEKSKNKDDVVEQELSLLKKIFLNAEYGTVTIPEVANDQENGELTGDEEHVATVLENTVKESSENTGIVNEVSKQQVVVQYLKDYLSFHNKLQEAINVICQLLGSKTTSDVQEAIEFLVIAYEFGLSNALRGVRRMLLLIWSKDNAIHDAVVQAYERLYLNPQVQGQRAKAAVIVRNLMTLIQGASTGELASLDELVFKLMETDLIPSNVVQLLWEKFTMKVPQTTPEESRDALKLLGMMARGEHGIVDSNIDILVTTGLGDRAGEDAVLVKDTCTVLLRLNKDEKKVRGTNEEPTRFPADHVIFQRLVNIMVTSISHGMGGMWVPMATEAVNVIYQLAENPDGICATVVHKLLIKVLGNESDTNDNAEDVPDLPNASQVIARLLSLAGHIAFRQLVHLDTSILGEIKRRERVKEDEKGKEKTKSSSSVQEANATPRSKENEGIEDELGLTGATAEDTESEYIKSICDREIVTGNGLLSLISPMIIAVCNNPTKYTSPELRASASIALAKFMLVSSEFCENNLQLLFTILEKSPHAVIRANTIICLGDLTFRFPNLIEPWTAHLYARLRDESVQVRKNTLMVLTHLILNDMVKVKGQISEMATCLEDQDQRIAELAKLFFFELSKKGNAVYNILPDVISRLSDPDNGVKEETFRNIMKYLFSFIQKDRQCETLVEKLCHRFRATRSERQWRDLAFCLAQLSYNERGVRKLQENFACFHDKLSDKDVHSFFVAIIGKCKKFAKPEMKVVVDELEGRITSCHEKGVEDEAGFERATQASEVARLRAGKTAATPATKKTRGRTPARRGRGSESDNGRTSAATTGRKSTKKKNKKKVVVFDSDEDEEMLGEEDWNEVFDDINDDDDDFENITPNIRPVKSGQKPKSARSSRRQKLSLNI